MAYERSAGCIVFLEKSGKRLYLLLHKAASGRYRESWSFPKGIVEKGEEEIGAAVRETREEAGITDLQMLPGFREKVHYIYTKEGRQVAKDVIYFLAKTGQEKVKVSEEHAGYEWAPYDSAVEKLTFNSDKKVLKKAELYLKRGLRDNLSKFFS